MKRKILTTIIVILSTISILFLCSCSPEKVVEQIYVQNNPVYFAENVANNNIESALSIKVTYKIFVGILENEIYYNGAGFIISEDGYVVTNAHVIYGDDWDKTNTLKPQGLQSIEGTLTKANGEEIKYNLSIVAKNGTNVADLALLKMVLGEGERVKPVAFRNSENIHYGEYVVTIGNPKSLGTAAISGIVSRPLIKDTSVTPNREYILLDIAMNHGNSGGALFDKSGYVIGICTMRYITENPSSSDTTVDVVVRVGYAINSKTIAEFINDLDLKNLKITFVEV